MSTFVHTITITSKATISRPITTLHRSLITLSPTCGDNRGPSGEYQLRPNIKLSAAAAIELTRPEGSHARTAKLLDPAIFGALLVFMGLVAIPYGSVQPWWEAVFECGIFALGAAWIVDGLLNGAWRVSGQRMF